MTNPRGKCRIESCSYADQCAEVLRLRGRVVKLERLIAATPGHPGDGSWIRFKAEHDRILKTKAARIKRAGKERGCCITPNVKRRRRGGDE